MELQILGISERVWSRKAVSLWSSGSSATYENRLENPLQNQRNTCER
jgi:hypothetical protein